MQPPVGPQTQLITRRYFQDVHYTTDAANMAAAGWRVASIQREPGGAIVALYAPVSAQRPLQALPQIDPMRVSGVTQRRIFGIVGVITGGLVLLAIFAGILNVATRGNHVGGAGDTSSSTSAQSTNAAFASALDATATANAANATGVPALQPVAGAQLGGPITVFDARYGGDNPPTPIYQWDTIIARQPVRLSVTLSHTGDSLDGQYRAVFIDITTPNGSGAAWSAQQDATLVSAFLPSDAQHVRDIPSSSPLGPEHVFMSAQLAASLVGAIFQDGSGHALSAGTLSWQCSSTKPYCEIGVGTNS